LWLEPALRLFKFNKIYFFIFLITLCSCVAGGPQLSIDRQDGTSGTPTGAPAGTPNVVPSLERSFQSNSVGSTVSRSEHFTSASGLGFVYGKESSGNIYHMVAPGLSLQQTQIKAQ